MVRWLSPGELTATGVRALLSGIFGSYADRREMQAALHHVDNMANADPDLAPCDGLIYDYSERTNAEGSFWIDFAADLGDGFDSTYSIAWLLAQPSLPQPQSGAGPVAVDAPSRIPGRKREYEAGPRTLRGQILVLGGDQVYPTPLRDQYANRFSGPYEAALPWVTDTAPPHLYAIPGNHDWYDGLTAFLRLFCQLRWIGGWKTQQRRSYFVIRLPNRWWLLGLDVQLESDIDQPQRDYFCAAAKRMNRGDRAILCTPEPTWVHARTNERSFDNLAFFERTVLAPSGVELAVTLTGDMHHYARYTDAVRPDRFKHHKITAGGGGAFLLGTQLLPDEVDLPAPSEPGAETGGEYKERYTREAAYPSALKSRVLKTGALRVAWENPSFAVFLGMMYAVFAWFLQSASKISMGLKRASSGDPTDFMVFAQNLRLEDWQKVLKEWWVAVAHSPLLAALAMIIIGALITFTAPDVERSRALRQSAGLQLLIRVSVGLVHGIAHLMLATAMIWFFAWLNLVVIKGVFFAAPASLWGVDHVGHVLLFIVEMGLVGGFLGAVLFSLFLLPGVNHDDAFSSQHLEAYKNFVRLQIDSAGTLTVYPYGLDDVARWRFRPHAEPGHPYYSPKKRPRIRLIEGPIVIAAPSGSSSPPEESAM